MNALFNVWHDHEEVKIAGTQYTLIGFSLAALRTNFYIKQLDVMLDAGLALNMNPVHIFITHAHSDHIANLPYHLYGAIPPTIYCPEKSAEKMRTMIQSAHNFNDERKEASKHDKIEIGNSSSDPFTVIRIVPVKASQSRIQLTINKTLFEIEIFKCFHSIACVGYGFIEKRSRLKAKYIGMEPEEIGRLRKSGIEITDPYDVYFLLFLGDTNQKVLENKELEKYSTIMIECTFILDEDVSEAKKRMHMHWQHLEEYVRSHSSIQFILYHFSQRYKREQIETFFKLIALPNVTCWVS